tara:strand:- start:59 stop:523 length:465 start_codon:yes stop_codon:yes gene_type:complete
MSGVIYKIVTGNELYVGSTMDLHRRRIDHKKHINNKNHPKYGIKLYKTIRDNGGEWELTIYEENLSMTKEELRIREEEVRLLLGATLNSKRAYRTEEQRKQAAKETELKHREVNRIKKGIPMECECGCSVRRNDIARHRKSLKHFTLMISHETA